MNKIQQLSILVVQQEDFERDSIISLLQEVSAEIFEARDGDEAWEIVSDHEPDILITDIVLDKIDGIELIEKAHELCPNMKIIVAYSPYSPKSLIRAVELGANAFLSLPLDSDKMINAVSQCARDIIKVQRMTEAEYSLKQLLDYFPTPALLVDGLAVTYLNRRLTEYLGKGSDDTKNIVDVELEDFITRVGDEPYNGHPTAWIESIMNDQLDRDHVLYIENPRHPDSKPNIFTVTFNQFPGSDLRLFTFQDVSELEDERAHLEDEASTDPLTKALNRRSFLRLVSQMAATRTPFSLIMFDIDHFKSINDTYGHDVGDAVLREISTLVRDSIRENDTLARWGGEEFMVLSAKSNMKRATRVAERLRKAVADFSFTGVPRQITSSFGVAMHTDDEASDDLVKRTDEALYEAKETGRNKVVVS